MLKFRTLLSGLGLTALTLTSLSLLASDPASHDVTVPTTPGQVVVVEWTGTINPGASGAGTNTCDLGVGAPVEDSHSINLTAPEGVYSSVSVAAAFHVEWDTAGSDMVLSVIKDGTTLGSSDGGAPEENVVAVNPRTGEYLAVTCPFAVSSATPYRGRLTLTARAAQTVAQQSPEPTPGNASGPAPRFQHLAPDYPRQGFGMFGGEATLDINTLTGSIFYIGFLETLRLKLDELTSPPQETWELGNTVASSTTTSDPILVSDRETGRVFAMQLLLGPGTSAMDYTDDDGETWTPGMAGAPFRSGADHQGMDVGNYPASGIGSLIPHPLYPNAVYYCSQDVADVYCARSDDGGVTFKNSVVAYTVLDCQGLHGHPKVAPDGTVYVPVSGCPSPLVDSGAAQPAVVVSEDAGITWAVRPVSTAPPGMGGHGSDPSVAFGTDGTVYMSYVSSADSHLHMVVSKDRGLTWINDVDVSALSGIRAAEFPAVVAGDPDRAGVAFFGTTYTGPELTGADNFPGNWYLFSAVTYDGGLSYHVVNTTPGDPIQKGGICGAGFCRNLLDFFDAVLDTEGRMLIAYEDGCVSGCPKGSHGTFTDQAKIARQSGGRRLFAAFDPVEPARPAAPRLSGYREGTFTYLEWPATDSGGATITEYKVYRGDSAASLTLLQSVGTERQFVDTRPPAGTLFYAITATNNRGEGAQGNVLALNPGTNAVPVANACALPGLSVATDRTGEPEAAPATRDVSQIFIAEPEAMPGMLVFTLQFVQAAPPNQGGGPPSRVFFDLPNGGASIRLQVTGAAGAATYGHLQADETTGNNYTLIADGSLEPGSGYLSSGAAQMIIAKDKLGLQTGDRISGVYGLTLTPGAGTNILTEEAGYADYTLVGNDFCAKGGIVLPPVTTPPPVVVTPPASTGQDQGRFGSGALSLALLSLFGLGSALRHRNR